jgi:hypothetical protein
VAWFEPDVSGTYVFSLVVRDGGGAAGPSAEVEVEVAGRVANNAPVADAGGSIIDEATIACNGATLGLPFACKPCADATIQLDGAATLDPDGDSVSYRWTLLSGNGSLLDETSETPTVLVTGPAPDDIGETAREVVYVALEVTDCMGATSTQDVITVAYECTGVSP